MSSPRPLFAVVLAAGGSTRFEGGAKQLAQVDGRSLVSMAIEAASDSGAFDAVVVVEGAVSVVDHVPESVVVLHNPRWADGQATSLTLAVEHARAHDANAIVVGLADQPGIGASDWRIVAEADDPKPIVIATFDGVRGNPVRLAKEVWDLLPTEGDEGARVVARLRPELVGEVACPGDPRDVDTREDLDRWN